MADLAKSRVARGVERRDEGSVSEYLAFRVGGSTFAIPVSLVREIARGASVTPVPRAPSFVLGISSFRGRIVTVVDLGRRLGLSCAVIPRPPVRTSSRHAKARVLMVETNGEAIGLLVDEVLMVYRLANRDIERTTQSVGSDVGEHVAGIARPEGESEVILLLEVKALLS